MNEEEMKELLERLRYEQTKPKRAAVANSMRRVVGWVFNFLRVVIVGSTAIWVNIVASLAGIICCAIRWDWAESKFENVALWGERKLGEVIN